MFGKEKIKKNVYRKKTRAEAPEDFRRRLVMGAAVAGLAVVLVLFGFSVVAAYDYLVQSPYFAASRVDVTGNRHLTATEVLDCARIPADANVLAVNLSAARKRLLAHPWIAWAAVSRRLPDGIEIDIREHTPVAVCDMGRKSFLLNSEGRVFKAADDGDPAGLPVVEGLRLSDVSIKGEPMRRPAQAVVDFLNFMRGPGFPIPQKAVTGISVDADTGLSITAFEPTVKVALGWDDYSGKMARLKQVMYDLAREKGLTASAIDLTKPDRVVVKPVQQAVKAEKSARKEA